MTTGYHDGNHTSTLMAVSSADGKTPVEVWADPNTHRLLTTSTSSGITSINADSTAAQILDTGTSGTDFAIADDGMGTHTFNLPVASATNTGKLSSTDWSTFDGKQAAGNYITALTGDVTASGPGSVSATLATVNTDVGSFTNASITVNGKGLITAASSGTAPVTSVSGTSNRITSSGGATPVIDIAATYVGQSSITTVGTLSSGAVPASLVTAGTFGTGAYTMDTRLTVPQILNTPATISVSSNAGTVTRANRINNFTNDSAATMAITLSTTGALDGDMVIVRIYDFSAVAQTIGWTNTEDSTVTAPTTSNGSTTLPLTVGFQYNSATSKWRTIAKA